MHKDQVLSLQAPGKVMIAGEWGVLEPGNHCIVFPVNRYARVTIKSDDVITLDLPTIGIENLKATFNNRKLYVIGQQQAASKFDFVRYALQITLTYLAERGSVGKPFRLHVDTQDFFITASPSQKPLKLGLGSSAAVTVAVTKALLAFHGHDSDTSEQQETIFKLAYLAHYHAQHGVGSGFDIAASTYEKSLYYRSFDRRWLANQLTQNQSVSTIVASQWPLLVVTTVTLPKGLYMAVGFVGQSASTRDYITAIQGFKRQFPQAYHDICSSIESNVQDLHHAFMTNSKQSALLGVAKAKDILGRLAHQSGVRLETERLALLAALAQQHGAVAKLSGAGGGDCGIAFATSEKSIRAVEAAWQDVGIYTLPIDEKV